jgi:hypothetical protein
MKSVLSKFKVSLLALNQLFRSAMTINGILKVVAMRVVNNNTSIIS